MATSSLGNLLIVDDEPELLTSLCAAVSQQGYATAGFSSPAEALAALQQSSFDLLLCDLMMPEMDGIALLRAALETDPHLVAIIMTGHGTVGTAVEAMKVGAFDYVLKPFKMSALLPLLERALAVRRLRLENVQLRETLAIYELCQAIAYTLEPATVLNKLADAAVQQTQGDELSLLLASGDGRELTVAVLRGQHGDLRVGDRLPIDQGIAGWVARNKEPLLLHGDIRDPRFVPWKPRPEITSAITIPLLVGQRLVGVLNVNRTRAGRPFTLGQLKALSILAGLGAAALDGATLHAALAHRAAELEREVAQRRAAEEQLRLQSAALAAVANAVLITDRQGTIRWVNPAFTRMTGYAAEEAVGHNPRLLKSGKHEPERYRQLWQTILAGKVWQGELINRRKDGSLYLEEQTITPLTDEQGQLAYFVAIKQDVTERRRIEAAYRQLIDTARDVIAVVDGAGRFVSLNPAFARISGWPVDDWLGKPFAELVHPEDLPVALAQFARAMQGEPVPVFEMRCRTAAGAVVHAEVSASPHLDAGGVQGVLAIVRDVTDRKRLEARYRQAQKMEAFGQLAGGVAHDFNNLLTVICGYSDVLLHKFADQDPVHGMIQEIRKAGERATSLTRQLLAFSRRQILSPVVLDLNAVVTDMEKMLRRLIGEDIDLVIRLAADLGKVKADPGQIEQVLLNLVVNARDAMPTGGHLTIETSNVELDEDYVLSHPNASAGAHVLLSVRDSGMGMDADTLSHIFEPFFTTKGPGKGTGLGLATVFGIVQQSGGHITVQSEPGQGSCFNVYLPIETGSASSPSAPAAAPAGAPGGTETILLVEDEDNVRLVARMALEAKGYTVLVASSGAEALDLARQHAGPIHLLVSDVVMPHMSGRQLADRLTAERPELKVLFLSGYTDDAIVRHGVLTHTLPFLQKPFTPAVLARKVREVLDAPRR